MSVDVPTEYGGSGQSFFALVLVIEEMSKIDPSVGLFLDLQNTLINRLLLNYGTEEQKRDYLPRMAKDLVLFLFDVLLLIIMKIRCFRLVVFAYQNQHPEVMHLL
jgi:alkylation response protein AidB-like acyl-CoA dehydrogenase